MFSFIHNTEKKRRKKQKNLQKTIAFCCEAWYNIEQYIEK